MRQEGYAACDFHSDASEPREKLQDIPQNQKNYGGYGQREDDNEREDESARIKQHRGAHHAGYGYAGPNCGDAGVEVENNVEQTGANPADQIEEEIREVAEEILDVVAKDPEKKHVSAQVKPVGVEKHAGNQGQEGNFEADMSCKERGNPGGNRGVGEKQGFEGPARERGLQADRVVKDSDVRYIHRVVNECIGAGGVEVLERDEHGVGPSRVAKHGGNEKGGARDYF